MRQHVRRLHYTILDDASPCNPPVVRWSYTGKRGGSCSAQFKYSRSLSPVTVGQKAFPHPPRSRTSTGLRHAIYTRHHRRPSSNRLSDISDIFESLHIDQSPCATHAPWGGVDILNLPSSLGVGDAISPHVTSPFSNNYIYICVCMSGTVQWSSTVACITSHLPPYLRWVSGISSPELSSPLTSTLSLLRIAQLSALSLSRFLLSNVPTYNIALTLCNTPSGTEAMETGSWSNPRSSSSPRRRTRSGNYYTVQILRFAGIWFLTSSGEVSSVVGSCADKYCEARGEDEAVERELRAEYTCPFCAEDFDVVGLCCHMDEEHPSAVKSGVRFSALGLLIVHCCTLPWFAMKLNVDP